MDACWYSWTKHILQRVWILTLGQQCKCSMRNKLILGVAELILINIWPGMCIISKLYFLPALAIAAGCPTASDSIAQSSTVPNQQFSSCIQLIRPSLQSDFATLQDFLKAPPSSFDHLLFQYHQFLPYFHILMLLYICCRLCLFSHKQPKSIHQLTRMRFTV